MSETLIRYNQDSLPPADTMHEDKDGEWVKFKDLPDERAALRQRVEDISSTPIGDSPENRYGWLITKYVMAFGNGRYVNDTDLATLLSNWEIKGNLLDNVDDITGWLYDQGVRA